MNQTFVDLLSKIGKKQIWNLLIREIETCLHMSNKRSDFIEQLINMSTKIPIKMLLRLPDCTRSLGLDSGSNSFCLGKIDLTILNSTASKSARSSSYGSKLKKSVKEKGEQKRVAVRMQLNNIITGI